MTSVLSAQGLGKTYGRRWALSDCTLDIPAGRAAGACWAANGAGKTTLLNLAVGLLAPTTGTIEVLGGRPAAGPEQLAKVGFVAQDTPTYEGLSIEYQPRLGAHLNPGWDDARARDRIQRIGLDLAQRAGKLSGGQRAQLALTLGVGKRPQVLILDEPVASLDPLARREFLQDLMGAVAGSNPVSPTEAPANVRIRLRVSRRMHCGVRFDQMARKWSIAGRHRFSEPATTRSFAPRRRVHPAGGRVTGRALLPRIAMRAVRRRGRSLTVPSGRLENPSGDARSSSGAGVSDSATGGSAPSAMT